jgi:Glycosyltransferase family 87
MHRNLISKNFVLLCLAMLSCVELIAFAVSTKELICSDDLRAYIAEGNKIDFLRAYTVSEMAKGGDMASVYRPALFLSKVTAHGLHVDPLVTTGWLYPPVYTFMLYPLSLLPYKASFLFWAALQTGLLFAASYRFLWFRPLEALALWSPAVFVALDWGQNGVLVAAIYVCAFRYLKTWPLISGICFGCAIIKPQLGILLPTMLLLGRHHKVSAVACLTALALIASSLACYGTEPWSLYLHALAGREATGAANPTDAAARAITISSVYNMARSFALPAYLSIAVQCICALFCVYAFVRHSRSRQAAESSLVTMVHFGVLSLLASPYCGLYDYVLAVTAVLGAVITTDATRRFSTMDLVAILGVYESVIVGAKIANATGVIVAPAIMLLAYFYVVCREQSFYIATVCHADWERRCCRKGAVP